MEIGLLFWVIMLIWLLSWVGTWMNVDPRIGYVNSFVLWILLALLGWKIFGPMLHG